MKTKAFSIYDSKALCFGAPFTAPTVGSAVRSFADLANDPQTTINRHPSDFLLYEIGEYDDSLGNFNNKVPPLLLGTGRDFLSLRGPAASDLALVPAVDEKLKEVTKND